MKIFVFFCFLLLFYFPFLKFFLLLFSIWFYVVSLYNNMNYFFMPMLNKLVIWYHDNYSFNVPCITDTWYYDAVLKSYLNLNLSNYDFVSQKRTTNWSCSGVLIYIHKNLSNKLRNNLSISDKNKEVVTIGVARENGKNIILRCC